MPPSYLVHSQQHALLHVAHPTFRRFLAANTNIDAHTEIQIQSLTHAHTQTHMHACTHTRTHIHTHIYTSR